VSPEEKLELVQRSYKAFGDRNADALIPLYASDCEWLMTPSAAAMFGENFIGHDGLRSLVEIFVENASSFEAEILEAKIADDRTLLIRGRNVARSAVVGAETELTFWQVIEFRDRLILRVIPSEEPPAGWDTAKPLGLEG
jgi:SnoaL-like protein